MSDTIDLEFEAFQLESGLAADAAYIGRLVSLCTREADAEAQAYIRSSNYTARVARWKQVRGW
jgi:hypothetical protein